MKKYSHIYSDTSPYMPAILTVALHWATIYGQTWGETQSLLAQGFVSAAAKYTGLWHTSFCPDEAIKYEILR